MNKNRITIIVPCRQYEEPAVTLNSLKLQTFQDFKVVVVKDQGKGANWARNEGFKQCDTEFVLFSDNDLEWKSNALETKVRYLDRLKKPSYCYGRYILGDKIWGHQEWNPMLLKKMNYISTMGLIRAKDFPGFDESITRLQDWDLWLTMLEQGKTGVYCDDLVFMTAIRPGITYDHNLNPFNTFTAAEEIVKRKHGLLLNQ